MCGDLNSNLAEKVDLSIKRMIAILADDLGYFYGWHLSCSDTGAGVRHGCGSRGRILRDVNSKIWG